MIPRSQHFGDRAPFPLLWSGIMRIFEQPRLEALVVSARSGAHYAGKQPDGSVEKRQSGHFAAREDKVSDRDFLDLPRIEQPLVDPLEPAAQDDRAGALRQLADTGL